jgi:Na+/H+ antiporter NhaD/arsenite permease-like protein
MIAKLIKWIAIAALFLALFWQPFAENRILLRYLVWAGAIVLLMQAVRAGKYLWIGLFLAAAVLFNPIRPLAFSAGVFLVVNAITLVLFMVSLGRGLRTKPRLSIASITDRTPGSESL